MTPGIAALGPEAVARIVQTIAVFDDFCHANDPYQEHDFGSFEVDGKTYMLYLGNSVGRYGFGLAELEGELGT